MEQKAWNLNAYIITNFFDHDSPDLHDEHDLKKKSTSIQGNPIIKKIKVQTMDEQRHKYYQPPKENNEPLKEKQVCRKCGNDTFRVYIKIIIDDARLYCAKCGEQVL